MIEWKYCTESDYPCYMLFADGIPQRVWVGQPKREPRREEDSWLITAYPAMGDPWTDPTNYPTLEAAKLAAEILYG